MKAYLNSLDELSRRRFVERSAKSLLGVSLLPALGAKTASAQAAGGGGKAKSTALAHIKVRLTSIYSAVSGSLLRSFASTDIASVGLSNVVLSCLVLCG